MKGRVYSGNRNVSVATTALVIDWFLTILSLNLLVILNNHLLSWKFHGLFPSFNYVK
jgi:hypothetical protein